MWMTAEAIDYWPVIALILVGAGIGIVLMAANAIFGVKPRQYVASKYETYECGVPPEGNAKQQFSVRYYLVGIVFLLFDVEVVFLYPWAVVYRKFLSRGSFIMLEMVVFFLVLLVSYFYLIRKDGLSWD